MDCVLGLLRPRALLCASLVLIVFLFPEACLAGGKKHIPPVKHLFGVGIGYQRVIQYKPVLVFQKHKRKHRPSGWGWGGGGGGGGWGRGWKSYTPVVLQKYVHGGGGHGHGHDGGGGGYGGGGHARKRRRPHHHGGYGGRGWGWRRKRRPHYRGHGHRHHHHSSHHHHDGHGSGHPEYAPPHSDNDDDWSSQPSYGPAYGGGESESSSVTRSRYPSSHGYHGEHEDYGGYESEMREQWNKPGALDPPPNLDSEPFSSSSSTPAPAFFPFTEPPTSDAGVTKIHKQFLRSHTKHYKDLTSSPAEEDQTGFSPSMQPQSQPNYFSAAETRSADSSERRHNNNNNAFYDENSREIEETSNELDRIINDISTSTDPPDIFPTSKPKSKSRTRKPLKIKPSPPAPTELGTKFNDPSFFPSFDHFKNMKIV